MRASATLLLALMAGTASAQSSTQSSWPTYHGDDTGQHHSKLDQITAGNVGALALSWVYHAQVPSAGMGLKPAIKATPLEVDGVLYFSMPNQVWAIDARTGHEIWTYTTKSGSAIGNRGVAVRNGTVYMETPDSHLVALDAATGNVKWRYATPAAVHGAATVVDGIVYFSTLKGRHSGSARFVKDGPGKTFGLSATTGKEVWRRNEGRYTPIIADGQRVYFTGLGHLYGLEPTR